MTDQNENEQNTPEMNTSNEKAPSMLEQLNSPDNQEALTNLLQKVMPLVQGGRLNNIVDLLSLVSDLVEFMDEASLEKTTKAGEEMLAAGWAMSNAVRLAHSTTCAKAEPPSLIALTRQLNDPDTRRGMHFILETIKLLGKQMQHYPRENNDYI